MVGPFIFFDQMAVQFVAGRGLDVRPHPHIGLAMTAASCIATAKAMRSRLSRGDEHHDCWARHCTL